MRWTIFLILSLCVSCATSFENAKFKTKWYQPQEDCALVPKEGPVVWCYDPTYTDYMCLSKNQIATLRALLKVAKIPTKYADLVEKVDEGLKDAL